MIRRGEGGWVDARRAFMVARCWVCERIPPQVSTGNRTAGDHKGPPFPTPPPSPLRMLMSFSSVDAYEAILAVARKSSRPIKG